MTEDILHRLNDGCPWRPVGDGSENMEPDHELATRIMGDAADEIGRLRHENEALRRMRDGLVEVLRVVNPYVPH